MNKEELREIRDRCDRAAPISLFTAEEIRESSLYKCPFCSDEGKINGIGYEDSEGIYLNYRKDIPRLLDEVDRLQALVEQQPIEAVKENKE